MEKQETKKMSLATKLYYLVAAVAIGITLYILWPEFFPKPEIELKPVTPSATPSIPSLPKADMERTVLFKTSPGQDTTVIFTLRYNDYPNDVEWRNVSNMVAIWHSELGASYQIVCHEKQNKEWFPMPDGGEFIFNNGKKLTVKFEKEPRPTAAPLDWLK